MFDYDTVVIGAGTAGLSAGRVLQDAGKSYLIIDSKARIGVPVRSTGGISSFFVQKLKMPVHDEIIAARIRSIGIQNDSGDISVIRYDHDVGFVYKFTKYEEYLARGLNINLNTKVLGVAPHEVRTTNGRFTAANIIIATGPTSSLAPVSTRPSDNDMIVGYEETRKLPPRSDFDVSFWLSRHAPGGYIWDFPDAASLRRIGIGVVKQSQKNPALALRRFTEEHTDLNGYVDHSISHMIPVAHPPQRVVFGSTMIAGDAANTVFASTGGGLQGATWSGQLAGKAAAMGNPEVYQHEWKSQLYPLLMDHYRIKKIFYTVPPEKVLDFPRILRRFKAKTGNDLVEIPRMMRHLIFHDPIMIIYALKAGFTRSFY
ncbi:MAG: NAD(P)/FAD-dependent oxidoreductase [Thermoplasmataceae archaeon]